MLSEWVDFASGDNIYHLKGNSSAFLSEILGELKIKSAEDGHILTIEDVADVRFSDESLVSITQKENDWLLTAEEPFDTEETLTLTLKNGETVSIQVTDDNTDFGQYISNVVVEKKVGNGWVQTTEFNNGDTVRIRLAYDLPAGVITAEKKTVTYQLPDGVKPGQSENGDITQNGKKVGTYTIDTNGLVTLTFDDAFAQDGKGIDGTVRFQGTVSNTSGGSSGTITFPGNGSTITVITPQQDNYDISTAKEGSVNADHTKASYKVTVSTNHGTGNPVTVSDQFSHDQSSNAQFSYDQSSLTIYKVYSNGGREQVTSGYSLNWTTASNGDPGFEITGLPALSAGEKYEVAYDANISVSESGKKTTVVNQAYSRSGNHDGWAWNSEEIRPSMEKTGEYDPKTNTFSWTLWLNNGNGADVSSWRIIDQTSYPITGSVTVYCRSRNYSYADIEVGSVDCTEQSRFDIQLSALEHFSTLTDDQKKDNFYIVYSTQAPKGQPGQTVSEKNQAWCYPDSGGGSYVEITPEGKLRDWDVSKKYNSQDTGSVDSDGKVYEHWSSEVTLPVGSLTEFTYTDDIEAVLDDAGQDQHYATAKDLENYFTKEENPNGNRNTGLYLKLGEYERYNYNGAGQDVTKSDYYGADKAQSDVSIAVTYYDAKEKVVQPDDDQTRVKKFTVKVTPASGSSVTAQFLVLKDYRTVLDTNTQKDGQEWAIKNKGTVGTKSSEAEGKYKKPYTFDKQVYTGSMNGAAVYKDGSQEVPYQWASWEGLKDGQLKYRLMLHTAKTDEGTITITDTLPAGMTLVDGSVYAKFFQNENSQHDQNWGGDAVSSFTTNSKPVVQSLVNEDETTTLTITIPEYHWSSSLPDVAVYYTVDLSPEDWNDLNTTEKSYQNTAEWSGHTSTNNVKVTREKTILEKSGVQLDKDGKPVELGADGIPKTVPSGTLQYAIVINPGAEDLVPNAGMMTLTDILSGAANYNPQLDLDSVALYEYDSVRPDHLGKKLDARTYMFKYDALSSKITLTIPDSRALVFVYQYALEDNYTGGAQISNEASLNGEWSTKKEVKLVETTSSATAGKKKIVLYKVDSQNYRHPLPGTKFMLERYDGNKIWTRVDKEGNISSDAVLKAYSEGKIVWDLAGQTPPVQADTLYRLTETEALEGYQLDTTHHYFIWRSENSSADVAYNKAQAGNQADDYGTGGVPKDKISIFPYAGGVMYIENTYTRIAVEKVWQNADGSAGTMPKNAQVQVQLQRQTSKPDGYTITVTEVPVC